MVRKSNICFRLLIQKTTKNKICDIKHFIIIFVLFRKKKEKSQKLNQNNFLETKTKNKNQIKIEIKRNDTKL